MLVALDMMDDDEYRLPYIQALVSQILAPANRIAETLSVNSVLPWVVR